MGGFNDRPPEATVSEKLFTEEDNINLVPVTFGRQNVDLPKTKTRTNLKYKSGAAFSVSVHSSPPSFIRTSALAAGTSVSKHAQSIETKRPNTSLTRTSSFLSATTDCSLPSSSGSIVLSTPTSKSSVPPSVVPSRSTTPVHDIILENQDSSRGTFSRQAADGLWPSIRSLSSSFQSEYLVHVNKKDDLDRSTVIDHTSKNSAIVVSERKRTPLIGRNTSEQLKNPSLVQDAHSRAVDQHRWPAMKGGKVSTMKFSRSLDLTDRIGEAASFMLQSRGFSPSRRYLPSDSIGNNIRNLSNEVAHYVQLDATTKVDHNMNFGINLHSPYIRKGQGLPSINPSRTFSSHVVTLCHPSSSNGASMLSSSASIITPSPSSTRSSSPSFSSNNTSQTGISSPAYSHILDLRKVLESADMGGIHQLRLLHNWEVQWHVVNSLTKVALTGQEVVEQNLFNNVWNVTSELQDSVTRMRHKIETLKQEAKLNMLLKEQVSYLEDWVALEEEYFSFLFRTIEVLRASILRLPVTGGARVDLRAVKNAFSSAIDIMQAIGSSVSYLLSRVDDTRSLFCQLYTVVTKEKEMLDDCRALLATEAAIKVEECSLRAHILQQLRLD